MPFLLFLIAVTSAIDLGDPFEAKMGSEFLKAGPFGGNNSVEFSDLGYPHLLQKRACPVGSSLCTRPSSLLHCLFYFVPNISQTPVGAV